ncbi:MAG: hypothetical protein LBH13_05520 [Cellulomonadaceae bacterium]|nr:hypothetical protein [Cellulomonadaceae bacterium]
MPVFDRRVALPFAILGFLLGLSGVLASSLEDGGYGWGNLAYFTIWTNIAATVLFALWAIHMRKPDERDPVSPAISAASNPALIHSPDPAQTNPSPTLRRWTMYITSSIILVLVAYWTLLAPVSEYPLVTFSNMTTHLATPILFTTFYLTCVRPGAIRPRDIPLSMDIPIVYVIFAYALHAAGYVFTHDLEGRAVRFPYFFLDFHDIGWTWVAIYIVAIAVGVALLSTLFWAIDRRRANS